MHKHSYYREGRTRCFSGAVSRREENPAAHGGVCMEELCACGAVRSVNVNGRHREIGEWGPSQKQRFESARAELAKAQGNAARHQDVVLRSESGDRVVAKINLSTGDLDVLDLRGAAIACKALPQEQQRAMRELQEAIDLYLREIDDGRY